MRQRKSAVSAIAVSSRGFALVANEGTRRASVVDLAGAVAGTVQTTPSPAPGSPEEAVLTGKRFFTTGRAQWSLNGQAWGACQTCHPDGLSDNVTWYFARGPRQSTSLDGSFASQDPTDQRLFNWTAVFDEVADFELNTRDVSGGVGAIVSNVSSPPDPADRIDIVGLGDAGLDGSAAKAADPANPLGLPSASLRTDWMNITRYLQTIRSPRGATGLSPARVASGRTLFTNQGRCQGCHGGPKWTISRLFYDPTPATMTALQTTSWDVAVSGSGFPLPLLPATTPANRVMRFGGADADQLLCAVRPVGTFGVAEAGVGIAEVRSDMTTPAQGAGDANGDGRGYNPPSLLGVVAGGPYLHAGSARTLEALFDPIFVAHYRALAPNFVPTPTQVGDLVTFLLSIDEDAAVLAIPPLGAQGGSFCQPP